MNTRKYARPVFTVWKIVNEVINPNKENDWKLVDGNNVITDKAEIADVFNDYFVNRVKSLKDGIDQYAFMLTL